MCSYLELISLFNRKNTLHVNTCKLCTDEESEVSKNARSIYKFCERIFLFTFFKVFTLNKKCINFIKKVHFLCSHSQTDLLHEL